jgi:phosphoglucosamine mutase
MRETGETLAVLSSCMRKFPQVLVNVRVRTKPDLATLPALAERVRAFEMEMTGSGRVLIRYSGTEPLARVMVEGPTVERVQVMAAELAQLIRDAAAGA